MATHDENHHVHDERDHEHDYEHGHDHDHDHDHDEHDHVLITDRLPAGTWTVIPSSSEILFRARTLFGMVPVAGEFTGFRGLLTVAQDGIASGRLEVDSGSVSSGIRRRDRHLLSPRYLDAASHPQVTFTLEAVTASGDEHLDVTGELELLDVTIPLAFTLYAIAHGDHLHLEARAVINHRDAGFAWHSPLVSEAVRIDLALTLGRAS
ncbi:MAG: YceI family protein [Solirubrobacteraceae bacterium]